MAIVFITGSADGLGRAAQSLLDQGHRVVLHARSADRAAAFGEYGSTERPARSVYLSSGLHRGGDGSLDDIDWTKRFGEPLICHRKSWVIRPSASMICGDTRQA
jgi:NAD(P)-dependent dehydrogenase (short-subunit alcohol dehydrogenase family)